MKYQRNILAALVLAAIAGVSSAQGLSRAEVQAQLQEAIRNGDMLAPGQSGLTERQIDPADYPAQPAAAPGKTRAEVQQELAQAIRDGDMVQNGEMGVTAYQMTPDYYAAQRAADGESTSLAHHRATDMAQTVGSVAP
jgi:hypothetical protein